MKNVILGIAALCGTFASEAQQKEGRIVYQRKVVINIQFNGSGGGEVPPQTRLSQFELNFANGQMVFQQMEDDAQDDLAGSTGGVVIRTIGSSAEDVTFFDFTQSRKVEQRDFFDKRFLITDSIRKGNWKLTDETKTILNHQCRKAVSQRIGKRSIMNMQNGKMERKEVDDTTTIEAWFTTDIPVAVGPDVAGQLPGAILELTSDNGRSVYQAIDISPKANIKAIKEPSKGKKVNQQQFTEERNKMLEEMQRNGGGTIRFRSS
ncbi:MAG: GLPGLI family protein [Chitinophagaceae bacterium]|nr:GLPGLI family protein [Chitinophagaceae bacterium]